MRNKIWSCSVKAKTTALVFNFMSLLQGFGSDCCIDGIQHLVHQTVLQRPSHCKFKPLNITQAPCKLGTDILSKNTLSHFVNNFPPKYLATFTPPIPSGSLSPPSTIQHHYVHSKHNNKHLFTLKKQIFAAASPVDHDLLSAFTPQA